MPRALLTSRTVPTTAVLATAALAMLASVASAEEATWIRHPAISPDGQRVVFSYLGDLWTVPSAGGRAIPLTTHTAHDASPVWSPDGSSIAFASDRHGNRDVFLVASTGGRPTRLTFHSADDLPMDFTPDGKRVLFTSRRQDAPRAVLPTTFFPEVYSAPIEGGAARQELTTPALNARYSHDGTLVAYADLKGYENAWRKHHTSSVTRDIWIWTPATGAHRKLTSFAGEDRDPVWTPDDTRVVYLSERGGNANVWAQAADGSGEPTQITSHGPHPVRFLSSARDGTLCYSYHGELWVKRPKGESERVRVDVAADDRNNPDRTEVERDGATEMAVAPHGEEIAFVVRGEVFVVDVEHGTTKRVTTTPEQERSVTWGKDGRSLYYASERGGSWNLYRSNLTRDDEQRFSLATVLAEEPVLVSGDESFQPLMAPDGKSLAYLSNRDEIRVLDVATKATRTIVPAARNYSYADGDISFRWSPDSRWLAMSYLSSKRWIDNVGVVEVATGNLVDMSQSGYFEGLPQFSPDGRALLFASTRFGRRNHGSWGSDVDVLGLYLTRANYDRAVLSPANYARLLKTEEAEKEKAAEKKADEKKGDDKKPEDGTAAPGDKAGEKPGDKTADGAEKSEDAPEPVAIEFEDREHRVRRLTMQSAPLESFAISNDGEALVYFAEVDGQWDVWLTRIRDRSTRKLLEFGDDSGGQLVFSKDGNTLFVLRDGGRIAKVDVSGSLGEEGGKANAEPVSFAAELRIDAIAERQHLFEHVWRQAREKFYDPQLHGADWDGLRAAYLPKLAHIAHGEDFAQLLSELLGELNASHTGASYRSKDEGGAQTASLGLLMETGRSSAWVVGEVLRRGPADKAASKIVPGTVVTHIDGVPINGDRDPHELLDRKAGTRVRLALQGPAGTPAWEEVIEPISLQQESGLLYERWLDSRRAFVHEVSGGRVGYVHVRGMDDASFRRVFREALGLESDREALIVDTRFNGGGWLHDDLATFLAGRDYLRFTPRGKQPGDLGSDPTFKWTRPVAVVQSEGNYSDAHMFPWLFKHLGLGKLVGAPVAGTGTAVWWENLMDPTLTFGIPQVGMIVDDGTALENTELMPDVLVLPTPEEYARGEDSQLRRAVEVVLAEVDGK